MTRAWDNHRLTNLPLGRKLGATAVLFGGVVLMAVTWFLSDTLITFSANSEDEPTSWGDRMQDIAWGHPKLYAALFAANAVATLVILLTANRLFKQTSFRRRVRFLISLGTALLTALDVLVWLTVPLPNGPSVFLFGPVQICESMMLLVLILVPFKQMWFYRRWRPADDKVHRVVVVGGGFAGLYAIMQLDRMLGYHPRVQVTLIDKNNYFLFPPLLPSVAAGSIETRQVTYPFRRLLETTNVIFRRATVESVDPAARLVRFKTDAGHTVGEKTGVREGELPFDLLVLAPGSDTNTFKTRGVVEHAFFMRELGDAVAVRNQVIDCFERAAVAATPEAQKELLRFVIVGGGPTGVEVATEIHDLVYHVLLKRYPEVDPGFIDVLIVQSGKQILPGWNTTVVNSATRQLSGLKLTLVLDAKVVEVGPRFVRLGDGKELPTRTCVWCAGVRPAPLLQNCSLPCHESGRVQVGPDLRVPGFEHVFVLGDAAFMVDVRSGKPLPPLGQVAFQQGTHAAHNLVRAITGKTPRPFKYFNYGALVSVGEHWAAVDLMGVRLSGFIGWCVWRMLYLGKLVGTSNKVRVMLDWLMDLLVERSISQIFTHRKTAPDAANPPLPIKESTQSPAPP